MTNYISVDYADSYFFPIDLTNLWDTYTDEQKAKAINLATKQINKLNFLGERYIFSQELEFPRILYQGDVVYYFDSDRNGNIQIPPDVLEACAIQAKFLLDSQNSVQIQSLKLGITSVSIGSTSESYDTNLLPIDIDTGLCRESFALLRKYIALGY